MSQDYFTDMEQSPDCRRATEATLKDMGKRITWNHQQKDNETTTMQGKTKPWVYFMGYTVALT